MTLYNAGIQYRDTADYYVDEYVGPTQILPSSPRFLGHRTFSDKLAVFSHPLTHGVALTPFLRAAEGRSGKLTGRWVIHEFWGPGYSVGRGLADHAQRIRKSHRTREHDATTTYAFPVFIPRQACTGTSTLGTLVCTTSSTWSCTSIVPVYTCTAVLVLLFEF